MIDKYKILIKSNEIISTGVEVRENGKEFDEDGALIVPMEHIMFISKNDEQPDKQGNFQTVTRQYIEEFTRTVVAKAITESHKQIAGTIAFDTYDEIPAAIHLFNTDPTASFTIIGPDGTPITYSKDLAVPGDIIFNISTKAPTEEGYFVPEEVLIMTDKSASLITHNNEEMAKIDELHSEIGKNDQDISDLQDEDTRLGNRVTANEQALTERYTKTEVDSSQAGQDTKINKNVEDIAANLLKIQHNKERLDTIEPSVDDWMNTKGELVHVEDIKNPVKVDISSTFSWNVNDDGDLELDLSEIDMSNFVDGEDTRIKNGVVGGISIYLLGSYNDVNGTNQTINFNNKNESINVKITADKIVISSMSSSGKIKWASDVKTLYIEQVNITGTSDIDAVARGAAATAQTTANEAKAKADMNAGKINTNTAAVAGKQDITDTSLPTNAKTIVGSIKEIKGLTDTMNTALVNVRDTKLSDGRKLSEADPNVDADKIVIKKTLDAELGGKASKDLSNVNVGASNAGKVLQVKADGTLEYGTKKNIKFTMDDGTIINLKGIV